MRERNERAEQAETNRERRSWLRQTSSLAMLGGLATSYGTCGAMAGRFLYPARERKKEWLYVTRVARMKPGDAISWTAPDGEKVAIARTGSGDTPGDFVALSSTCPHLGCQVHWEGHRERFFCPCHNGVFTPDGKARSGPPAEAGQSLGRYPLRVTGGLLYIEAPIEGLVAAAEEPSEPSGPSGGHDPCLGPRGLRA